MRQAREKKNARHVGMKRLDNEGGRFEEYGCVTHMHIYVLLPAYA